MSPPPPPPLRTAAWTPHRPCPLWKITSTVFPANPLASEREREGALPTIIDPRGKESVLGRNSGQFVSSLCYVRLRLLVVRAKDGGARLELRVRILPRHSIGTLRKDVIDVKIPRTSGEVVGGTRGQRPASVDLTFRLEWPLPPPPPS